MRCVFMECALCRLQNRDKKKAMRLIFLQKNMKSVLPKLGENSPISTVISGESRTRDRV